MTKINSISKTSMPAVEFRWSSWSSRAIAYGIGIVGVVWLIKKLWESSYPRASSNVHKTLPADLTPTLSTPSKLIVDFTSNAPRLKPAFFFSTTLINGISIEIVAHIASFLDTKSALNLSSTCKAAHQIRYNKNINSLSLFRLFTAKIKEFPSDHRFKYAKFYEKNLWRVDTSGNISRDECDKDGLKRLWDLSNPWKKKDLFWQPKGYADQNGFVVGHSDDDGFLVFDIAINGKRSSWKTEQLGAVCTDKEHSVFYTSELFKCAIWKDGEKYAEFSQNSGFLLTFQILQNNRLITFYEDGKFKTWDITNPLMPSMIFERDSQPFFLKSSCLHDAAVMGSKEQWLVVCYQPGIHGGKRGVFVWDFQNPDQLLFALRTVEGTTTTCMTVIDDRWLAIGYSDRSIHIYSLETGKDMITYNFDIEILDVRFDGLKLWVAGSDKVVALQPVEFFIAKWKKHVQPIMHLQQDEIEVLHELLIHPPHLSNVLQYCNKPELTNFSTLLQGKLLELQQIQDPPTTDQIEEMLRVLCLERGFTKGKAGFTLEEVFELGEAKWAFFESQKKYLLQDCKGSDEEKSELFYTWLRNVHLGLDFAFSKIKESQAKDYIEGKKSWHSERDWLKLVLGWGYQFIEAPEEGDLIVYGNMEKDEFKAGHFGIFQNGKVLSKWGPSDLFLHELHSIAPCFGKHYVCLRKVKE